VKRARTRFASGILAAALLLAPGAGRAVCNVTATGVAFPPYDAFSPMAATGVGTVTVTCDEVPPPNVTLSLSTGGSGTFSPRRMARAGGGGTLVYNVFTTSGGTAVWGDGAAGSSTVSLHRVRRNEGGRITNVFGTIPPGQNVQPGSYSDTLTVTIAW
jgi:spore coat protein U-like protein